MTKKCTDEVDKLVERKKESYSEKICIECQAANDLTYKLCTSCNGKLTNKEFIILNQDKLSKYTDSYQSFQFSTSSSNTQVIVGEPHMISPSGHENIVFILRNIGVRAGIDKYIPNGKRQWLILENDGAIYTIIKKLIQNLFSCPKCGLSTYGKENVVDHQCVLLYNVAMEREFDWIILLPGLLHFEMNSAKAFMELNWSVFMENIVIGLGFVS